MEDFPQYLNSLEVADILKISTRTLHTWRMTGRGPVGVFIGGSTVRYLRTSLLVYLESQPEFRKAAASSEATVTPTKPKPVEKS